MMPVTIVRPKNWAKSDFVEVESSASDNYRAIAEIQDWAADHGFLRTNEQWLVHVITQDGKKAYRAICYRPTAEEQCQQKARMQRRNDIARESA